MRKTIYAISLVAGTQIHAQNASHCVAIQTPQERLACFDKAYASAISRDEVNALANWKISIETSQLDDSSTVVLSTASLNTIPDRLGYAKHAKLYIRCKEGTTSLFIHFAGLYMADIHKLGRIHYRVDDNPPQRVTMKESNNNEALGLWYGGVAKPFISNIISGKSLFIRATPYNKSPVEMTFNIEGLDKALRPLSEACDW